MAGLLPERVAIVTGAGSGIGRASAIRFAQEGAAVLVVDIAQPGVDETAALIHTAGGRAIAMTADAGVEVEVKQFVSRAIAEFGGLDIVFANAGISGDLRQ